MPPPQDVLDALVGLTFVAVGVSTRRATLPMRAWWVLVAVTWWLGAVPQLNVLHQGVVALALVAFPTGRLLWPAGLAWVAVGVLVGSGAGGQPVAAAAFAFMALGVRHLFPRLACSVLAVVLAGLWAWSRGRPETFDPVSALAGYEVVLLLLATGLPAGLAWRDHVVARLRDRLLASGPAGLPGLTQALRRALARPDLALVRDLDGVRIVGTEGLDASTRAAVTRAVDLTLAHEHAQATLDDATRQLERARVRLLAASDHERELVAHRLRTDLESLRRAAGSVRAHPLVARELEGAAREIEALVDGVPLQPLGEGRLPESVHHLCATYPGPATFEPQDVVGTAAAESTLFFVCSEALANVAKHAGVASVRVRLTVEADDLVLVVEDDGVGGADPVRGSGLTGLADRLATYGGTLVVSGVHPTGTRLEARISRFAGSP
ncbi:MAG: sensor histidine kinase [Nocardioides sp.]